jgi:hypothetical protein
VYPIAFPRNEAAYLQLALKLNSDVTPRDPDAVPMAFFEKDPVAG